MLKGLDEAGRESVTQICSWLMERCESSYPKWAVLPRNVLLAESSMQLFKFTKCSMHEHVLRHSHVRRRLAAPSRRGLRGATCAYLVTLACTFHILAPPTGPLQSRMLPVASGYSCLVRISLDIASACDVFGNGQVFKLVLCLLLVLPFRLSLLW
jgi:hypothetical protein